MIFLKKGKGNGRAPNSGDKWAVPTGSRKKQSAKIDCTVADKAGSHGHENHNVVSFLRSVHSLIERLIYFLSGHSVKTVSF